MSSILIKTYLPGLKKKEMEETKAAMQAEPAEAEAEAEPEVDEEHAEDGDENAESEPDEELQGMRSVNFHLKMELIQVHV